MLSPTRLLLVLALTVPLAALGGCHCTEELRTAIGGELVDANGDPVPIHVATTTIDGIVDDCYIDGNRYTCWERGAAEYALHIEADSFTYDTSFYIEADHCHIEESVRHDIVVP